MPRTRKLDLKEVEIRVMQQQLHMMQLEKVKVTTTQMIYY